VYTLPSPPQPAIEKLLKRAPSRKELASLVNSVDDSNDGLLQYGEFLKLVISARD
jgi:Ca2+-binding EF-hand superfamily protein